MTKDEYDENPREAKTPVDPLTREKYYMPSKPKSFNGWLRLQHAVELLDNWVPEAEVDRLWKEIERLRAQLAASSPSETAANQYTDSKSDSWRMVWDLLAAHNAAFYEQGESGREAIEIRRLQASDKGPCPHPAMHGVQAWKCDACGALAGDRSPDDETGASVADYEEVLADHRRLVRELDVLLNGERGAAKQASLCDIVSQVQHERIRAPQYKPSQEEPAEERMCQCEHPNAERCRTAEHPCDCQCHGSGA